LKIVDCNLELKKLCEKEIGEECRSHSQSF